MKFPFDVLNGSHSIYKNQLTRNEFVLDGRITFMSNGKTAEGWQWEIREDILLVLNAASEPAYEFRGVELVNGVVVAVGFSHRNNVAERVVMCETRLLTANNWRICVSSCPSNDKDVVPKLIKSMRQASVDLSKVTVVVGSVPHADTFKTTKDGILYVSETRNLKGFTALCAVGGEGADYHVLLHDTCMVAEDFVDRLGSIDTGLGPDIVLFRPQDEDLELGVYSGRFIVEQDDLDALDPRVRLRILCSRAKVVIIMPGTKTAKPPEDHYHVGALRQEWRMPGVGVSKFKSMGSRR